VIAPGAAREKVRVARALAELPQIDEALRRGELGYSKASPRGGEIPREGIRRRPVYHPLQQIRERAARDGLDVSAETPWCRTDDHPVDWGEAIVGLLNADPP
jgi:hypothetical protein